MGQGWKCQTDGAENILQRLEPALGETLSALEERKVKRYGRKAKRYEQEIALAA